MKKTTQLLITLGLILTATLSGAANFVLYVDGTNGSDSTGNGTRSSKYATIQEAVYLRKLAHELGFIQAAINEDCSLKTEPLPQSIKIHRAMLGTRFIVRTLVVSKSSLSAALSCSRTSSPHHVQPHPLSPFSAAATPINRPKRTLLCHPVGSDPASN